ncbi:MAG: hypothetical protein P4M07_09695 [Xanthobacteraceae bacterium]|nr:hypothetical protein [Xanthobacteraceae bacterium]
MSNEYRQLVGLIADDRLRWLNNFLADEPQWDRRTQLRLGAWAASTVGLLVVAILSVHWTQDTRREQLAAVELARQSQQIQATARQSQAENRRLTAAIDTLNGDRDRLYARVTVLEQGLESVTGAVTRQNLPTSLVLLSATVPLTLPPPIISAPPVMPAHVSDQAPSPPDQENPSAKGARAPAQAAQQAAAQAAPPPAPAEPQRPALPSSTLYAPPDPGAPHLVETNPTALPAAERRDKTMDRPQDKAPDAALPKAADTRAAEKVADKPQPKTEARTALPDPRLQVANAPPAPQDTAAPAATAPAATAQPVPEVPVQRTEFGVDLGGANSLDGLRGLWQGLVKADPALLTPLRPIVAIRERSNGLGMQLRLVAGPLIDAAAAARICASLAENDRSCETTVFDGQRLSFRAATEPAPAPPPTPHQLVRPAPVSPRSAPSRHAAARPAKREDRTPEPAAATPAPATTQSTPAATSILPEFLRTH